MKYVLTDVQGSGRALMNNSGSGKSTIVARHDYLPFGEEIWAGVGLRTTTQKYAVTDKVRQSFALTERDEATGLDHTWFRKYESFVGRWTSPDPYPGNIADPQTLNHYAYVKNDPVNLVDATGLRDDICCHDESGNPIYCNEDEPPIRFFTRAPSFSEYLWVLNSQFGGIGGIGGALAPTLGGFNLLVIAGQVNSILADPDCIAFANTIMNAVSSKDNPALQGGNLQQVFRDFLLQKKGGYTRVDPGSAGYGSATGSINKGNAKIFSPRYSSMSGAEQTAYDSGAVVAELFHLAGKDQVYTDRELAEAAHAKYSELYKGINDHTNVFHPSYHLKKDVEKNPNHGGWSSYFHDIQRQLCGP